MKDFELDNIKEIILDGEPDIHRIAFITHDNEWVIHYATDIKSMKINEQQITNTTEICSWIAQQLYLLGLPIDPDILDYDKIWKALANVSLTKDTTENQTSCQHNYHQKSANT